MGGLETQAACCQGRISGVTGDREKLPSTLKLYTRNTDNHTLYVYFQCFPWPIPMPLELEGRCQDCFFFFIGISVKLCREAQCISCVSADGAESPFLDRSNLNHVPRRGLAAPEYTNGAMLPNSVLALRIWPKRPCVVRNWRYPGWTHDGPWTAVFAII